MSRSDTAATPGAERCASLCSARVQLLIQYARWQLRMTEATTQTTRAERDALARHVGGRVAPVEIGVWQGVTTKRLRAAMAPNAELWAVDPYPVGRLKVSFPQRIAHGEVDLVENGRVRWVRKTGAEAAALWRQEHRPPADFLFVDGDHSWEGISADWTGWNDLIAVGGVIALHDSRTTPARPIADAGSVRFTDAVIRKDPRFCLLDEVDSLTVFERVA